MVTPVSRVTYAYLQEEAAEETTQNNNLTFTDTKRILKKLLNVFHKFNKNNNSVEV